MGELETKEVEAVCEETGKAFKAVVVRFGDSGWCVPPRFCLEVEKRKEAELKAEKLEARRQRYRDSVPVIFQETNPSRLDQNKLEVAMEWASKPNHRGLIIVGETGMGKTRMAFLACEEWAVRTGRTVKYLPADRMSRDIATSFDSHKGLEEVVEGMVYAPLLFIDDLGKERISPRVETCLFEVVRERTDNRRQTLITSNFSGDDLIGRFKDRELAEPLVRRLREADFFQSFKLDQKPEETL